MTAFHRTTQRRLKKIPQIPSVWEGDRRSLSGIGANLEPDNEEQGECIIWVDGSEGFVRAMDVVSPEMGPEAMVRTLLRAIEHPHSPAKPARPQKIVVRDREMQFFLRGALQNLDIVIDYVPELPLIDELFRGFEESSSSKTPRIPPQYETLLLEIAYEIWDDEPWDLMADHDILAIELNRSDPGTIYVCVMGMLGREYGVILYRSLDSLKRFRSAVILEQSMEGLEKAFLAQDCWFLNFEVADEADIEDDEHMDLADLPVSDICPIFGSVHPYEGMRPFLDEEEASTIYVALKALQRFFQASQPELAQDPIGEISKNYRISLSIENLTKETVSVKVSTMPELSSELLEMIERSELEDFEDEEEISVPIQDDFVPDDAFLSLGFIPWDLAENLRQNHKIYYPSQEIVPSGEGMPVILIQTSRPKAKIMIEKLQNAGGVRGICFNPGEDPFTNITYDLGILQAGDGDLYILAEFISDDSDHVKARKKWDQRSKNIKGYCGLIIARGIKGASRGNPQLSDMMALFETKSINPKDLGMGVLQLMPQFDFDFE
ncbi:MAG: hypothetical protein F6K10_00620 [Moorea sp. SIO2B7]|nr:hypothetical protein [Moorena sp. SIO2B7]